MNSRTAAKPAAASANLRRLGAGPRSKKARQSLKKRLFAYGLVGVNLLIVVLVGYMVLIYSGNNNSSYGVNSTIAQDTSNPLDALSAADIAVNIARMANLPEATAVTNYADTIKSEIETHSVRKDIVTMPQIITANIKTMADAQEYVTVEGDTVGALAAKFGVTSDSIKWSNGLTNDALAFGIKLFIPPMNGILYTVHAGDTPERIAQTYSVAAAQIIQFNDAELSGLAPGMKIFLPNAQQPAPVVNKIFFVRYGNNGYDPGWCTYYAAAHGGAPPGWGHARTWAVNAARTPGWTVSKIPVPGSIAQTTGTPTGAVGRAWGHVGVVDEVKEVNGEYFIKYSDMNGIAGFNRVGHSDWVPALAKYQNFIYRTQ